VKQKRKKMSNVIFLDNSLQPSQPVIVTTRVDFLLGFLGKNFKKPCIQREMVFIEF
jgi:hypothetical protein